jgi:hypothetical protein
MGIPISIWLWELGGHDNDFGVNDTIKRISTNLYFCTSGMGVGNNVLLLDDERTTYRRTTELQLATLASLAEFKSSHTDMQSSHK